MQFALNKKLEHRTAKMCTLTIKGHPDCLVVHIPVQLYITLASKTKSDFIRIKTDVLAD